MAERRAVGLWAAIKERARWGWGWVRVWFFAVGRVWWAREVGLRSERVRDGGGRAEKGKCG